MVKRMFLRPKKNMLVCYSPWIFGNMFFLNPKSLVFKQPPNVAERPAWRIWMAPPWRRPNLSPAVKRPKGGKFLLLSMFDVSKLCSISFIPQNRDTQTHLCVFEGWWKTSSRFINMKPRVGPDLPIKTLTDPNFQVPCQIYGMTKLSRDHVDHVAEVSQETGCKKKKDLCVFSVKAEFAHASSTILICVACILFSYNFMCCEGDVLLEINNFGKCIFTFAAIFDFHDLP